MFGGGLVNFSVVLSVFCRTGALAGTALDRYGFNCQQESR